MNKLDFIKNELTRIPNSNKKIRDNNIVVLCPFHKDTDPSFSISIDDRSRKVPLGYGRCWSCSAKGGWNTFAEKLGLKKFGKGELSDEYMKKLDDKDKDNLLGKNTVLNLDQITEEFKCYISYPITEENKWRGFSGKFLKKFSIHVSVDEFGKDCVLVPVYNNHEIVGAVKAFSKKSKNKKITSYLNYPGPWIKEYGIFPYDYVSKIIKKKNFNFVIICEGMRDALSLILLGMPAVCIFGTQTWTDKKLNQIKALGIDTLVIMMDAGKSGISSTNLILEKTKGKGISRIAVKMQKWQEKYEKTIGQELGYEIDPNNCPKDLMKKIIKWIHSQV